MKTRNLLHLQVLNHSLAVGELASAAGQRTDRPVLSVIVHDRVLQRDSANQALKLRAVQ